MVDDNKTDDTVKAKKQLGLQVKNSASKKSTRSSVKNQDSGRNKSS